MHQRFDRIGILSTGKLLTLRLSSCDHRDRQILLHEIFVYVPHHLRALFRFLISCMDGVSLLPQEFSGTQEGSCGLLPSQHGTPLVPYFGKITVRLYRLAPYITEQSLRSRAYTEPLLKLLHPSMCHPRHLRRKAFNMILLLLKKTLRNQNREIDILYSRFFKPFVKI